MSRSVLFLVPYPEKRAPSQRFRVELFLPELRREGIRYKVSPFMSAATWKVLYEHGSTFRKLFGVLEGFLRRWFDVLIRCHKYDYVFIHREAAPLGPPVFEWMLKKLFRKKIIFDFDDAIWIPNTSSANRVANWLKNFGKVKHICRWSYKVAAGNDYLARFAREYNSNVVLLPTVVDMAGGHNRVKRHGNGTPVIAWTGSHSTMRYLDPIAPALAALQKEGASVMIISDKKPALPFPFEFVPWSEKSEVEDLVRADVGLMPLENDNWSEGKCGFKLIQYLSLGIPAVASPVGVNNVIIEEGRNGYLASTEEEWKQRIGELIANSAKRQQMGEAGRNKMLAEYSLQANWEKFISLFS